MNLEMIKQLKNGQISTKLNMFSIITYEAFEMVKNLNLDKYKIASRSLIDNFSLVKDLWTWEKNFYFIGHVEKDELPITDKKILISRCKSDIN